MSVATCDEGHHNDAHRFLCILQAVAQSHGRSRERLQHAESAHRPVVGQAREEAHHDPHEDVAEEETDERRSEHRDDDVLDDPRPVHFCCGGEARSDEAADEGVRGGGGQTEPPGDEIPDDRSDECGQDNDEAFALHHEVGGRGVVRNVDDALADRLRDFGAHEGANDIHDRCHEQSGSRSQGSR